MLIEYTATDFEDKLIDRALQKFEILNWFNPEDDYYVLETNDPKVVTVLALLGIEIYISGEKICGTSAHL